MTNAKSIAIASAVLALVAAPGAAGAQAVAAGGGTSSGSGGGAAAAPPTDPTVNVVNKTPADTSVFTFNYGVPTSTALNLIGGSADKMVTSTALRPFVLQLPQNFGAGQGQSVGLDLAPAWLAGPKTASSYTADTGVGGYFYRLGYRTHLTAALSQGTSNSDPTKAIPSKAGVGASAALLETSDPLYAHFTGQPPAWSTCTNKATDAVLALEKGSVMARLSDKAKTDRDQAEAARQTYANLVAQQKQDQATQQKQKQTLQDAADAIAKLSASPERDQLAAKLAAQIAQTGSPDALEKSVEKALADAKAAAATVEKDTADYNTALQATYAKTPTSKEVADCVTQAGLAARYAPDLEAGAGALWDGVPGRIGGFNNAGEVVWLAGHFPLLPVSYVAAKSDVDNHFQAGFSVRSSWHEIVATGVKATPMAAAELLDGWAGLQYLGASTSVSLQGGYQYRHTEVSLPSFQQNRWRYLLSLTQEIFKKGSGTWVSVSYGDTSDDTLRKNEEFLITFSFTQPKSGSDFGTK